MDYEERLKRMIADGAISQDVVMKYVPELAESEDERIRKWLVEELYKSVNSSVNKGFDIDMGGKALAWLEKQGEHKSVMTEDKDAEKAAEEYRTFRMSCGIKDPVMLNEIEEAYYEGAIRQQKPVEWSEEDESMLQNILECLKNGWRKLPTDILKYESWLKLLKERMKGE